jgi:hypothetical protein
VFVDNIEVGSGKLGTFQPPRQSYMTDGALPNTFAVPYTNRLATGVTAANDSGAAIFTTLGLIATPEASSSPVPNGGGGFLNYGQFLPRVSYCSTKLIYASFVQGLGAANNLAIFSFASGVGEVLLAQKGSTAPGFTDGSTSGTFSNFLGEAQGYLPPSISPGPSFNGEVIRASVVPPAGFATRNEGIWRRNTWVGLGALRLQLLKGEPDPALPPGVSIQSFLRFGATLEDHLIAWVRLQGPGVTAANDGAILLSHNTYGANVRAPTTVLLREGFPAPGCGGARVGTIQTMDMGSNGSYVVLASLIVEAGAATTADNQALFMGAFAIGPTFPAVQALPRLMLRKGAQFVRSGSPTVKSISLPGYTTDATGAMNTGLARLVTADANYSPTCSAVVTFNDGQTSLLRISP